jgi:acetyl-CoA acetyltransferase
MLTRELNAEIMAAKTSFENVKVQPLDMFRVYVTRYMLTRSVIASKSALGYTDITEQITEIPSGTSRSAIF